MTKGYRVVNWRNDQRQIVASELIPQGTIIMKEDPLVWVKTINQRYDNHPWDLTDLLLSDRSKFNILMSWKLLNTTFVPWDNYDERICKRLANNFRLDNQTIRHLYELICINNLSCFSKKYEDIIGYGIFHNLSFINHDCTPNSSISAGNPTRGEMMLTSVKEIEQGESITFTYLSDFETKLNINYRRKSIESQFGFICECNRCSAETSSDRAHHF